MRLDAGERTSLFEDPLFERSQEWKLSTSGLSPGKFFRGTGCVACAHSSKAQTDSYRKSSFGTPYHNGYGINCE